MRTTMHIPSTSAAIDKALADIAAIRPTVRAYAEERRLRAIQGTKREAKDLIEKIEAGCWQNGGWPIGRSLRAGEIVDRYFRRREWVHGLVREAA